MPTNKVGDELALAARSSPSTYAHGEKRIGRAMTPPDNDPLDDGQAPMTPDELLVAFQRIGGCYMTVRGTETQVHPDRLLLAAFLMMHPHSVSRLLKGEVAVSGPIKRLLQVMIRQGLKIEDVL